MTVSLDLSADYLVFDGNEAVTCYQSASPQSGNGWTPNQIGVEISVARVEKIEEVEVQPSAGVYDRADTRIRLPATLCEDEGYTPAIGDTIEIADGTTWTVLAVGRPRFNNSWSCFCRKLNMPSGLADSVSLLSATVTNVHGSKVTSHASVQSGIACRIQPMGEQEMTLQARRGFDVNYVIYTSADVDAKFNDLFLDEATGGDTYEIKFSGDRKRLDAFSTYYCRRRP